VKSYRVTFWCKPGNHWRHCSEVVIAETGNDAVLIVKNADWGMVTDAPYEVEQE